MAAYKYKQSNGDGTITVDFNITPDIGKALFPGDTIAINGTVKCNTLNVKTFDFWAGDDLFSFNWYEEINLSVAKGKTGTFSMTFKVEADDSFFLLMRQRTVRKYFVFSVQSADDYGETTDGSEAHYFNAFRYHLDPKILAMDFERATPEGEWADDGQYLQCKTLKIAINPQADQSDITRATITCAGSDGSSRSVDLTQEQLAAALASDGCSETEPGIFADFVSSLGVDYTLTLTLGDDYDQATFTDAVMRSFARLHLSGAKMGGMAVGMFSTATDEQPKFEVAETHMTYFYGCASIHGLNEYALGEHPTGGHWIDGRPIYRWIWTGTTSLSGKQSVVCAMPVIPGTMLTLRAMLQSGTWRCVPNNYYADSGWNCAIFNSTGANISMSFGKNWTGTRNVIIFAEYTKKEDEPDPNYIELSESAGDMQPEIFDDPPYADEGVARADYIAMMAGIEIPEDAGAGSAPGASDPRSDDAPGIEDAAQHSARYATVKLYFDARVWNAQMVRDAAGRWITAEEAQQILNDTDTD